MRERRLIALYRGLLFNRFPFGLYKYSIHRPRRDKCFASFHFEYTFINYSPFLFFFSPNLNISFLRKI